MRKNVCGRIFSPAAEFSYFLAEKICWELATLPPLNANAKICMIYDWVLRLLLHQ
jgi:hypothetical protein